MEEEKPLYGPLQVPFGWVYLEQAGEYFSLQWPPFLINIKLSSKGDPVNVTCRKGCMPSLPPVLLVLHVDSEERNEASLTRPRGRGQLS